MSYTVKYTDNINKTAITVNDSTINQETSLALPGRNQRGYGIAVAENFLHLLENFAYDEAPTNPVEGQVWYDTSSGVEDLKVYDGTGWKLVGAVRKGTSEPTQKVTGDLWVDTDNQQLFLFNGASWVLVGPTFSSGLRTGIVAETVVDSNDIARTVLKTYISDEIVAIYSVETFIPKVSIAGFTTIKSGMNISTKDFNSDGTVDTKYWGTAEKAENLIVGTTVVASSNFLRKDTSNITNYGFTVRNDVGISTGNESQLRISVDSGQIGNIYHSTPDSAFDIRVTYDSNIATLIRADSNGNVGIGVNNLSPAYTLDVLGTARITDVTKIESTENAINDITGALQVSGGALIKQDLIVRGNGNFTGHIIVGEVDTGGSNIAILPQTNNLYTIGTSTNKFSKVYSTSFYGNVVGNVEGDISGTANEANKLKNGTTFQLTGQVTAEAFTFDGSTGGTVKTFNTSISPDFIASQTETTGVDGTDTILIYRPGSGLRKMSRGTFFTQVATVPVGSIMPFAGTVVPLGYLLCDGSEKSISNYDRLFSVIGYTYGNPEQLIGLATFRLPDLRGRFPMGNYNMDNGDQITSASDLTIIDSSTQIASGTNSSTSSTLGNTYGSDSATLQLDNIPDHKHNFKDGFDNEFYAIRNDNTSPDDPNATAESGLTATTQSQIINRTGGVIRSTTTTSSFDIMNPYLTINYIIYTGKFE
jgi:hypothetical protein